MLLAKLTPTPANIKRISSENNYRHCKNEMEQLYNTRNDNDVKIILLNISSFQSKFMI